MLLVRTCIVFFAFASKTSKVMVICLCCDKSRVISNGKKRKREKTKGKKRVSGFILFASDRFKRATDVPSGTPKPKFGDIQKENGSRWKLLSDAEKAVWKQRADEQNAQAD